VVQPDDALELLPGGLKTTLYLAKLKAMKAAAKPLFKSLLKPKPRG
jgi:hypothetical protein